MNIQEATKLAVEQNKFITRDEFKGYIKIQPTNRTGNCIISTTDNSGEPRGGWQPHADDLSADDWKVIDGDYGNYKEAKFAGFTIELEKFCNELEKSPQVDATTSEDLKKIKGIKIDLSNHDIQPKDTK